MRYGPKRYSWFGFHINFLASQRRLIIGAPASNDSSNVESGNLYGFDMADVLAEVLFNITALPKWIIKGTKQFDLVGTHTSIGRPYDPNVDYLTISLTARDSALGSTQLNQTGAVLIINPTSLTGTRTIDSLIGSTSTYIKGNETYGRFGWFSAWSGKEFFLSAPFMNNHGGKVYAYQKLLGVFPLPFPAPGTTPRDISIFNNNCYQDQSAVHTKGGRYGSIIILPSNSNVYSIITAPRTLLSVPTQDTTGKVFVIYN